MILSLLNGGCVGQVTALLSTFLQKCCVQFPIRFCMPQSCPWGLRQKCTEQLVILGEVTDCNDGAVEALTPECGLLAFSAVCFLNSSTFRKGISPQSSRSESKSQCCSDGYRHHDLSCSILVVQGASERALQL
jgi:hypothetical protein